jgi:hypothetical protein
MRVAEKVTPVLGALSALATLACCLPIAGASMLGLGSLLGALGAYQAWLLPVSGLLLVVGGVQIWRSRRVCKRTSKVSLAILGASAVIVALVLFFPQSVAGFLTEWLAR